MGWIDMGKNAKALLYKYKFVLIIIAAGILLMLIPSEKEPATQLTITPQTEQTPLANELEEILAQMAGVGKVKVMITESVSAETVFQTDENHSSSLDAESKQVKTVIISNSGREEEGLIKTVTPPIYLGAIIVCQGGDSPTIRLQIVQAVANVTGISSDRITVLKMK